MTRRQLQIFQNELLAAGQAEARMDIEGAFLHLSRAHILSQRATTQHVFVHWRMLCLGARIGDWREVVGQFSRILAAALFSRIWVPIGNTGRANVSAFRPMDVPDDLKAIIEQNKPWRPQTTSSTSRCTSRRGARGFSRRGL